MLETISKYKNNYTDIFLEEKNEYNMIFKAKEKNTNKNVFLKVYDKRLIDKGPRDLLLKQIKREEELTNKCKCENVIELYQTLETDISIIFVYEIFDNNLSKYIKSNGHLTMNEKLFIKIVKSIAEAMKVLYKQKVIHRDIKPSNIYYKKGSCKGEDSEDNYIIKLANFGTSIEMDKNDSLQIGTLLYLPPEIINNLEYDEKCDMWSLGITLYQLYFGFTPYGIDYNFDMIQDKINSDNFIYKLSDIPTLDILFKKLLEVNKEKRMTHEEFYDYVFSPYFMVPGFIYNRNIYESTFNDIQDSINTEEYKNLTLEPIKVDNYNLKELQKTQLNIILNMLTTFDIASKKQNNENTKFVNIIYYNEKQNHLKSLNEEINMFKEQTSGTFFFCKDIDILGLLMLEIKKKINIDKRYSFNLIVPGSIFDKIIKYLKDYNYEECFQYICIFCRNKDAYLPLMKEYNNDNINNKAKIAGIYSHKSHVIKYFIDKYKSQNIKPFPLTKLITYEDYQNGYFNCHKEISELYGFLSKNSYLENINILNKLSDKKEEVNQSFSVFDFSLEKDVDKLKDNFINEYSKNTFFGDLNRLLRNQNKYTYEETAYFISRFIFTLNEYAKSENKYYNENKKILYRGATMAYTSLIAYERAIGKIIILTQFIATSKEIEKAKQFAKVKGNYPEKFSVLYYIKNLYKQKWISNGIDIQDIPRYKKEKEILFLPFSFYKVIDVKIDIKNKQAEIYLETIGKIEILEKAIQQGKFIKYDKELDIVVSSCFA